VSNYNEKVVDYWSQLHYSATESNFYTFPPIRARSCKLMFGEDDGGRRDYSEYWTVEKYLKHVIPVEKCLSICSGFGEIERILARLNVARKIIGTDIAPEAIRQARQQAQAEGLSNIEYYVSDLNESRLPAEEYDVIWANGALHHIKDLDRVVPMLKHALKPGGYLISNEYVGPNYRQIGRRQQEIVNAVKHLLPAELCRKKPVRRKHPHQTSILSRVRRLLVTKLIEHHDEDDEVYERIFRVKSIEECMMADPSECVNSSAIIPTLREHFENVEVLYYDGSILKYALDSHFYANYDDTNERHRELLNLLFRIEDTLISTGDLPRDHAEIICRKQ